MSLRTKMSREIADVLGKALDGSVDSRLERFGLCQYDMAQRSIVDIIPPEYFEYHELVEQFPEDIAPDHKLMEHVGEFNRKEIPIFPVFNARGEDGTRYKFMRENGVIVPYHTHWQEDKEFYSSVEDVNWTFGKHDMYLDIVVAEPARMRGVIPPVCVTFNPRYTPFTEQLVPYITLGMGERVQLDDNKGWQRKTHEILRGVQMTGGNHISLDFVVGD